MHAPASPAPRRLPYAVATVGLALIVLSSCAPGPLGLWQSPFARDHPLVGRLWDVRAGSFVEPAAFFDAAGEADYVLLGEQHDNADHHRFQAWTLRALLRRGRWPAVVFEQVDREKAEILASVAPQARALGRGEAADYLAEALDWEAGGWPAFREYKPVFAEALGAGLALVAGNVKLGHGADVSRSRELAWMPPLPAGAREILAEEIRVSHCGMAPESMVAPMIDAQRARDAVMARSLVGAGRGRGAVLIAGFGHTRRDFAVPLYVEVLAPGARVVSLAMLGVRAGADAPGDYADAFGRKDLPFDFVWFTPRASEGDPCEEFREALERMRAAHTKD